MSKKEYLSIYLSESKHFWRSASFVITFTCSSRKANFPEITSKENKDIIIKAFTKNKIIVPYVKYH